MKSFLRKTNEMINVLDCKGNNIDVDDTATPNA